MHALKRLVLPLFRYFRDNSEALRRRRQEDFLKALYHHGNPCCDEAGVERLRCVARIPKDLLPDIVGSLVLKGLITTAPITLTEQGERQVLHLIRTHRIYEKYLAEHSGYTPDEWHTMAEEMEHKLSADERERIARLLRNPLWDPHGDPIPTEGHRLPHSKPVTDDIAEGEWYQVLHIEDDDASIYKAINRVGLAQGCILRLMDIGVEEMHLAFEGDQVTLPTQALASLNLKRLDPKTSEVEVAAQVERLTKLQQGEVADILGISPACLGAMRRRLLDLGFVRGSEVCIDMRSPMGNPTAYVVRHTAVALREDQARHILVKRRPSV